MVELARFAKRKLPANYYKDVMLAVSQMLASCAKMHLISDYISTMTAFEIF